MAVDVKYKGDIIATAESGQTATLKCSGYKMDGDVEVTSYGSDISAEELGAVVDAAVSDALQKAKESGAFDGKDGTDGKDGAPGPKGEHGSGGKPVTDYGAKGDGTTDDTVAFQNALAANRIVFVPEGTYKLSGTLVIEENSCLELTQATVLRFTQTSANCIGMKRLASIKGNHATIIVPYEFTANVIDASTTHDKGTGDTDVPPFTKWDPQWKMSRYVTNLNICKPDSRGFHYSVNGDCNGTAVYMNCNPGDGQSFMWGVTMSGLRIAGAFNYGIRLYNTGSAWNHDVRVEAVIDACKIGVSVENCRHARLAVTVQPRQAYSIEKVYSSYAEHGIKLVDARDIDLTSSRVWDWMKQNDDTKEYITLFKPNNQYQHIAMYGDCKGLLLDDYLYYAQSTYDIRDLIYTDTPSNLEKMTILQEPIDRWFKIKNNAPYVYDGFSEKLLVTQENLDARIGAHFDTDFVKGFTDVLVTATDENGAILNDVGYINGYYVAGGTGVNTSNASYSCIGFIPIKQGDTLYVHGIKIPEGGDGRAVFAIYDTNRTIITTLASNNSAFYNQVHYYFTHTPLDDGFKIKVNKTSATAYIRFGFRTEWIVDTPMMAINEEIKYFSSGFLADGIKVKGENVIGDVSNGTVGPAGPAGADGKTAYEYAQDGGYAGTEAEFAAKLAEAAPTTLPNPNALTINGTSYDGSKAVTVNIEGGSGGETVYATITYNIESGETTSTMTAAEIMAAYKSGCTVVAVIMTSGDVIDVREGAAVLAPYSANTLITDIITKTDMYHVLIECTDSSNPENGKITVQHSRMSQPLTINGVEYDGSKAVTVNTEGGGGLALLIGTTDEITPTQVAEAVTEGRPVRISHTDEFGVEYLFTSFNILDDLVIGEILLTAWYDNSGTPYATFPYLKGRLGDNEQWFFDETLRMATVEGLPTTLPNPHKLTINGKVYDGSEEVTVNIEGGIDAEWVATSEIIGNNDIVIAEQTLSSGIWSKLQTKLVLGMTYEVYINDVCYLCVCYNHDDGGIYLGNGSLSGSTSIPHNNEPFCVYASSDSATSGFFYKTDALSYPLTLKVTGHSYVEYNKLPKEYLPDDIGGNIDVTAEVGQTIVVEEVDANGKPTKWKAADYQPRTHWSEMVDILPEATLEDTGEGQYIASESAIPVVAGEEYIVNFNGTEYTVECVDMSDMVGGAPARAFLLGTMQFPPPDGEPPFGITVLENVPDMGTMTVVAAASEYAGTSITIGVKQEVVHPIPYKFLSNVTHYVPYYGTETGVVIGSTPDEIDAAYKNGANIILKWIWSDTAEMLIPFACREVRMSDGRRTYLFYGFCALTNNYQAFRFLETAEGSNVLELETESTTT